MSDTVTSVKIHRGDDTEAFNGGLFKIAYTDTAKTINKIELTVGSIVKVYNVPQFPLQIDFSAAETMLNKVGSYNINMFAYDENYKRLNIHVDATVDFVEPTEEFTIPYESPTLFDLGDIFPLEQVTGACGTSATYSIVFSTGVMNIAGTGAITSNPWKSNYASRVKKITIADGITEIPQSCFEDSVNLEEISIPDTVTSIGMLAIEPENLSVIKSYRTVPAGNIATMFNSATIKDGGTLHIPESCSANYTAWTAVLVTEHSWTLVEDLPTE